MFDKSNTTADETDGWRDSLTEGGSGVWQASTQSLYEAGNVNSGTSDGWRTAVVGANNTWTAVTLAQYNGSNTTSDANDGWRAVKSYPENGPYDGFDGQSFSAAMPTRTVLEALVAPEGVVPAVYNPTTQSYGDVRDVNMFAETNWSPVRRRDPRRRPRRVRRHGDAPDQEPGHRRRRGRHVHVLERPAPDRRDVRRLPQRHVRRRPARRRPVDARGDAAEPDDAERLAARVVDVHLAGPDARLPPT